jgi:eukaryotic-like serine/threonine-protein kinase
MVGQTVSHYRILGKIGGGGMGVIYEAEDLRLGRHVALKFVPENVVGDEKSLDRFRREARAASRLNHPNICTIHDIEDNNGHPFIVMERLEGDSLKQRLQGKPLDLELLLDVAVQIAQALEALHAKGIIHRDIKPANVFITQSGQVKVLDFGLAKISHEGMGGDEHGYEHSLTAVGVVPGTAVYMSPEQARGEDLDPRSDIFSFGVVLYEMATGQKPFRGTNVVTTLDAMLHKKPASPRTVNPALPAALEGVIGKAMEKDRDLRYQKAAQMKADLQRLRDESESAQIKAVSREARLKVVTNTFAGASPWPKYLMIGVSALLVTILAALGTWWFKHRGAPAGSRNTIAVLPLQNMNGDFSVDYLRFALADEIANVLTETRTLDVRPSSITRKYVSADLDPQKVGKELRVAEVVTGHFIKQGDYLLVTLEAVDTTNDRLLWQTSFSTASQDAIALQNQLTGQLRQGMLPSLGVASSPVETGPKPKNAQAYDLYLHSLALPHDPGPNKDAIAVLREVVRLDPTYAPAWEELGLRYYYDSAYSDGGEDAFQKSNEACQRALQLDPNRMIAAAQQLTINQVNRGELGKAYQGAEQLLKSRPESAQAHFSLAYVLRYAGMQEESARECDTALALDPGNFQFRSCAWAYMELGKTQRAMDFIRLDAGSEWAAYATLHVLLREGKTNEAKAQLKSVANAPRYHHELLESCLGVRPASESDRLAQQAETAVLAEPDPEPWYYWGTAMAYCGKKEIALHMINAAVEQNYCAYSALLMDPLLQKLRSSAEFDKVLTTAHECQQAVKSQ